MNGQANQFASIADPATAPASTGESSAPTSTIAVPATRARLRMKHGFRQNRFVIIGAGLLVGALLLFVAVSVPRNKTTGVPARETAGLYKKVQGDDVQLGEHALLPITNAGPQKQTSRENGEVDEKAVEGTAKPITIPVKTTRPSSAIREQTLGSVPPFPAPWQAPPYQQRVEQSPQVKEKSERDGLDKSSFAYIRHVSIDTVNGQSLAGPVLSNDVVRGLGLPVGTRLRAHLESAVSTGLSAPVVALVDYNYERGGEIIVPAGTKAIGHVQRAERTGYMTIQFETLMMPDDSSVPIQAVATDLSLGPPKGKVEGKNSGKNLLLRSLSGIGQAGALLVGHGSLNQPLSEADMLRERISNNIGQASDEQFSRLSLSEHLVVTIPAATSIYVIIEKSSKPETTTARSSTHSASPNVTNLDDLRQLLQLQRELQQRQ